MSLTLLALTRINSYSVAYGSLRLRAKPARRNLFRNQGSLVERRTRHFIAQRTPVVRAEVRRASTKIPPCPTSRAIPPLAREARGESGDRANGFSLPLARRTRAKSPLGLPEASLPPFGKGGKSPSGDRVRSASDATLRRVPFGKPQNRHVNTVMAARRWQGGA